MSFTSKAIKYFSNLNPPKKRIGVVEIINPWAKAEVKNVINPYFNKYYNDNDKRIFVLGINPGRFGAGLTGISFTDPVALRESCRIENSLGNRKELSSKFIYSVVDEFGGAKKIFSKIFLTALYSFALVKDGKNYNYYDDKSLAEKLKPEIVQTIKTQIEFGARRDFTIILGKKNADYFLPINEEHKFFKQIAVLEHPRYIMQYRLKKIDNYIKKYLDAINN